MKKNQQDDITNKNMAENKCQRKELIIFNSREWPGEGLSEEGIFVIRIFYERKDKQG